MKIRFKQKPLKADMATTLSNRNFVRTTTLHRDPNYCVRLTAEDGAGGEAFLELFQENSRTIPTILTTSQKL
jgi:type I restriction enzyme R subunit